MYLINVFKFFEGHFLIMVKKEYKRYSFFEVKENIFKESKKQIFYLPR